MTAKDEIEINASPQTVFDAISDYGNIHSWMSGYKCNVSHEGPLQEGHKVFHQFGKMVKFTREIDRIVSGKRIEESYVEGDLKGTGVWTFKEIENGTLVSFDCNVSSQALLTHIGILLTGNKSHKDVYAKILASLKKHCEEI